MQLTSHSEPCSGVHRRLAAQRVVHTVPKGSKLTMLLLKPLAVGSKEGWQPGEFRSSRGARAAVQQSVEQFLDEDELEELRRTNLQVGRCLRAPAAVCAHPQCHNRPCHWSSYSTSAASGRAIARALPLGTLGAGNGRGGLPPEAAVHARSLCCRPRKSTTRLGAPRRRWRGGRRPRRQLSGPQVRTEQGAGVCDCREVTLPSFVCSYHRQGGATLPEAALPSHLQVSLPPPPSILQPSRAWCQTRWLPPWPTAWASACCSTWAGARARALVRAASVVGGCDLVGRLAQGGACVFPCVSGTCNAWLSWECHAHNPQPHCHPPCSQAPLASPSKRRRVGREGGRGGAGASTPPWQQRTRSSTCWLQRRTCTAWALTPSR